MTSADNILEAAETRIRLSGYNAVSFRDIAKDVGIKSASLHYHFPKKEDLGVALVKRYSENFHTALDKAVEGIASPPEQIDIFIDLHRRALNDEGLCCLCAVLGAEAPGLPESVTQGVRAFFEKNILWLATRFSHMGIPSPERKAKAVISALEGALIVSIVTKDSDVFEAAADMVIKHK